MIIDRYERPPGITAPRVSDPILQEMDVILDDPYLLALVRRDLQRYYKRSRRGRRPVPVEVTLRMSVLRRRKKWSYRQAEQEVHDSPAYRWWVRVYNQRVPDHTTLNDLERLIRPETLHRINDRLMFLAQAARLTHGTHLRVDSSVTESDIHYPTDSSLLVDGIRVLSRCLKYARPWLATKLPRDVFASHTRSARRWARHIARLSRPAATRAEGAGGAGKKALKLAYSELIGLAGTSVAQARQVCQALPPIQEDAAQAVCQSLRHFLPLVEQVIDQATRRVLNNERVPAHAKLVSLFEPHTQIICRGKAPPHDTEFGHKVNYAEVEHGFISDWQVVARGNPPDDQLLPPVLQAHRRHFGRAPHVLAGDAGLFSPDNERLARRLGVRRIAIPQPGHKTAQRRVREKQLWFKQAQRFRNGIEGRISVIRRTVQLARCPYHGLDGFERWIGWGIIVANLVVTARLRLKRRRRFKPQ